MILSRIPFSMARILALGLFIYVDYYEWNVKEHKKWLDEIIIMTNNGKLTVLDKWINMRTSWIKKRVLCKYLKELDETIELAIW